MSRRRQAGLVATTLLASGCNLLLGLDPTSQAPADARGEPDGAPPPIDAPELDASPVTGHDEDGDGIDDGLDVCPAIFDDQTDGDGDGVGDPCDPNASAKGEVLLHFDGFGSDAGHWTGVRGDWMVVDDSLQQLDPTAAAGLALADYDLGARTSITIEVVGRIVSQLPPDRFEMSAPRGLGVWFVASGGSEVSDPEGYLCQARGDLISSSTSFTLWRHLGGVTTELDADSVSELRPVGTEIRIRAAVPSPGFLLCTVTLAVDDPTLSTLTGNDTTFVSGGLALQTSRAHARIDSITIIGSDP